MVTHLTVHGRGVLSSAGARATAIFPAATSTDDPRGPEPELLCPHPCGDQDRLLSRYVVTDETGMHWRGQVSQGKPLRYRNSMRTGEEAA
jgi:hypothetical protein